MSHKRPKEPVAPTIIPGEGIDPKIPPDEDDASEPDGRTRKPKVTPLDEDKHIEDGIEVNET